MPLTGRPRRVVLVALLLIDVLAIGVAVRWYLGRDAAPTERTSSSALDLDGPERLDAGSAWSIEITGGPAGSSDLVIDVVGPWGVRRAQGVTMAAGVATVPGEFTTRTGRLIATVRAGGATGSIGVDIVPGVAVDGVVPLAGPRSMIADLAHWTMVTALPRDRFGNVVADGTVTEVRVRRPDGAIEVVSSEVEHLLATVRVFSRTEAGRTTVRVDVDDATGTEVEVVEVPGRPVGVTVVAPDRPLRADGRNLVTLTTGELVDRFGNVLLDGTSVTAQIDGPAGRSTLRAVTIAGRAELTVESPPRPGSMMIEVVVDGVRSEPVTLDFRSDVSELPLAVERIEAWADGVDHADGVDGVHEVDEVDRVLVTVGPVLTAHGGFVADGTEVTVRGAEMPAVGVLRDGVVTFEVSAEPGAIIEVEVLGTSAGAVAP